MKKGLMISILVFLIISALSAFIVINKGHIGTYSLVNTGDNNSSSGNNQEVIKPKLTLQIEKDYLSSKDKKDYSVMTVSIDGEIVTDGVEFSSSNEKIAKVNNNDEVIPVGDGRATITAKYDGMEATDDIKVITPIKSMSFTTTNSTVRIGKDLQMKLKVTPNDASMDTLTYTSSDEEIATVNANGIVTGISAGKVTITVHDSYTDAEKSVNLTIRK